MSDVQAISPTPNTQHQRRRIFEVRWVSNFEVRSFETSLISSVWPGTSAYDPSQYLLYRNF